MTVRTVWGRIQRRTATLTAHEGSTWTFQVPPWATSPIIAEFWAEDEAGNIGYRAGVFEIADGAIKCIRWREEGSSLVMLPEDRPHVSPLDVRPTAEYRSSRPVGEMAECRTSHAHMLAHACSRLVEVGI